jgi:threonylcarbamoyladenosine tRNA methylthiotransferase MtaB
VTIEVVTFGCRLNISESETMRRRAEAAGIDNVIIVNTCAVTAEAVRQARQSIRRMKRERPAARVIVTGCAAQTEPQTFAEMKEVASVLENHSKLAPDTWIAAKRVLDGSPYSTKVTINPFTPTEGASSPIDGFDGHVRAFVQVQNGCDHRCTFCIIPLGRGPSRSVRIADVVKQARRLVDRGYREIVLTGVDLTAWGLDLPHKPRLGSLVRTILREIPELPRLRVSSLDPVEVDTAFMVALEDSRLMPHLHLSLQSGDDLILKRMKRRHSRADAIRFCADVRRLRPDVVFGADLIAGFPTETEAHFRSTLSLADDCGLSFLHVFPYSPRDGTPAARMPMLPRALVKERARRLRERGEIAMRRHLAAEIGRRRSVLAEGAGDEGHTEHFSRVALARRAIRGELVGVTIAGHDGRRLLAA